MRYDQQKVNEEYEFQFVGEGYIGGENRTELHLSCFMNAGVRECGVSNAIMLNKVTKFES
jgi:hypothetical protein